ncbi:MAG: apolipoprotein N-acyltransferase [Candidatus Margulisiibacteriota bacterium]
MLLSFISGALLAFCFPKFNLFWLSWVALVPFLLVLFRSKDLRSALFCGFWFGTAFWSLNLLWVFSLFRFAGWWVLLAWVCAIIFQTFFILLFVLLVKLSKTTNLIWIAVLWVAVEWLKVLGPLGVPLGVLGYSQASCLPILQIASFSSVYGISFIIVLANAAIANILYFKDSPYHKIILIILTVFLLGFFSSLSLRAFVANINNNEPLRPKDSKGEVVVSVIQPNIDQMDKMNPAKVMEVFNVHVSLTKQAFLAHPNVIIWPETALFIYALHDPLYAPQIKALAKEGNCWMVVGMPEYDTTGEYNSIVVISPSGEVTGRYDKEKLVPFGEYLPFRAILFPLLSRVGYFDDEFHPGKLSFQNLLVDDLNIAPAICSESAFPDLVRRHVGHEADLILTITNDGWFGNSSLPYFHLNAGILRAVENRCYFVQVGNSGISGLIDPKGRVVQQTKLGQRSILTFKIALP